MDKLQPPDALGVVLTIILLMFIAVLVIVWDTVITYALGQHNTVSRVLWHYGRVYPVIPLMLGLGLGMVFGHLFW